MNKLKKQRSQITRNHQICWRMEKRQRQTCVVAISLTLLVTACVNNVSKNDFDDLTPSMRAQTVCNSSDLFKEQSESIRTLEKAISDQNKLLAAGMRKSTTCRMVNESECAICTPNFVNRCTDHAVAIDSTYEANIRDKYSSAKTTLEKSRKRAYSSCVKLVEGMPKAEAYELYKTGKNPVGLSTSSTDKSLKVTEARPVKKGPEPSDTSWSAPSVTEGGQSVNISFGLFNTNTTRDEQTAYHYLLIRQFPSLDCFTSVTYRVVTQDPLLFTAVDTEETTYLVSAGTMVEKLSGWRITPTADQTPDYSVADYYFHPTERFIAGLKKLKASQTILLTPIDNPSENYSFEWPAKLLASRLAALEAMCKAI